MHSPPLANIPLFASLELPDQQELAQLLKPREHKSHDPIFWVRDRGDEFFIIKHGKVTLTIPDDDGREQNLATLGALEFFGELSLLDGGQRTATARATTDVSLLVLSRADFLRFLEKHPRATIHIVEILAQRQREMLDRVRGIRNVNDVLQEEVTTWNRIADLIASKTASQGFVLTHLGVLAFWMGTNLLMGSRGFDPFPFMLLAVLASLEAIFLSIFVLISQNRQGEKDRVRADLDYQVNVKSHLELMQLHQKVTQLQETVEARLGTKETENELDPDLRKTSDAGV